MDLPSAHALTNAEIVIWTTTPWTIPGNRAHQLFIAKSVYELYEVTGRCRRKLLSIGEKLLVLLADKLRKSLIAMMKTSKSQRMEICSKCGDLGFEQMLLCASAWRSLGIISLFRFSMAITSLTTPVRALSIPHLHMVRTTTMSGSPIRRRCETTASTPPSQHRRTRRLLHQGCAGL